MFKSGITPDSVTILTMVQFCIVVARVDKVKEIHALTMKSVLSLGHIQVSVWNALLMHMLNVAI